MGDTYSLEEYRKAYQPKTPPVLQDLFSIDTVVERRAHVDGKILDLLSDLQDENILRLIQKEDHHETPRPLKVGIVLSGGQAPGGHTVIAGLYDALMEWHPDSKLIGFIDGPKGLLTNSIIVLTKEAIDNVRNIGGFFLIGSGRGKIESDEDINKAIHSIITNDLDGLVIVGGDDSNTNAVFLAEKLKKIKHDAVIVGVPKTIDGDLQSQDIAISFGFDTACKIYSETISNLAKDCISSKKYYYFIRLMGRAASHITLECALQTHPNMAIISEEVSSRELTLKDVVLEIADLVEERASLGKQYGIILIPEGLIEHVTDVRQLISELNELFAPKHLLFSEIQTCQTPEEKLRFVLDHLSSASKECLSLFPRHIEIQLVHDRDPHGNVQVSLIETERLLAKLVEETLRERSRKQGSKIPFTAQTAFCGYEGRSAFPSNFDCNYCYSLGRLASIFIMKSMSGYITAIRNLHRPPHEWQSLAVPLASLLHFERRAGQEKAVIKKSLVDLRSSVYQEFSKHAVSWRLEDDYKQKGPMQFWGPEHIVEAISATIAMKDQIE